ncbi:hypothetical protein PInf_007972 [Phytophthora infestans]|nr:hypothetical protein PInf_007972 [Phytophthora infestans]
MVTTSSRGLPTGGKGHSYRHLIPTDHFSIRVGKHGLSSNKNNEDLPTEEEESSSEEDDEAVDVDSDDDNEGVSGTSSEEDAASTNLGAGVISNDSDADEGDTEADQPRAAQTIVV